MPVARAVERPRPDPEGAPVRPDQRRGQSRRGRQGALLLPRRDADAFLPEDALQVSAGAISRTRELVAGEPPPRHARARSTNCSTPASSTTTATSTCSSSTPRPSPDDILMRVTASQSRPGGGAAAPAAAALVPQHVVLEARRREAAAARRRATAAIGIEHAELGRLRLLRRRRAGAAVHARTRPTCRGCSASRQRRAISRTRFHEYVVHGDSDGGESRRTRHQGRRRWYQSPGAGRRQGRASGCACTRRALAAAVRRLRRACWRRGAREADEFYARPAARHRRSQDARACSARRSPA